MTDLGAPTLVLPAILALTALSLLMIGIAINFQVRRDRLPYATRYEHIKELRVQEETLLIERREELSRVEQKIHERDRLYAEVAALEERREALQLEQASLQSARQEIEEVKAEAAKAAADLALVDQELASKRVELQKIAAELDPARLAERRDEIDRLTEELKILDAQLPTLRAERDSALKAVEEGRAYEAQRAALQIDLDRLKAAIADGENKKAEVAGALDKLRTVQIELDRAKDELSRAEAKRNTLITETSELEQKSGQLGQLKDAIQGLMAELGQKRARHQELTEEIDRLSVRRALLEGEQAPEPTPQEQDALLEDLTKIPQCLTAPAALSQVSIQETQALQNVASHLESLGLRYHRRTVRAFHTALKINDNSQLTVLAGVSGTGKSLLPRRYAEAMGIHFLQIAVEPRWDSPQDLMGFYNYIEKKYRATELARLMVHLDPYCSLPIPAGTPSRKDHMALVLLDEMNIARVEYYFSEFLSRLEARPRYQDASQAQRRKDAMIPIDIRGLKKTISLFPSHNILFAGTMNDDESTQALSDKVLDRSNVLQFTAPHEFPDTRALSNIQGAEEALQFRHWRSWVKASDRLRDSERALAHTTITKLAKIMEDFGRPFGHRMRDAILAYVANYPSDTNSSADVREPLADQIELRILTKLRGVDIENSAATFDSLERLLRDDLGDGLFADRIAKIREGQNSGLFSWRGLSRDS